MSSSALPYPDLSAPNPRFPRTEAIDVLEFRLRRQIIRSLPYLFYDGMTFTLALTAFATVGGIIFGTLLAMMRLSGFAPISVLAAGYVNLMRSVPLLLVIF